MFLTDRGSGGGDDVREGDLFVVGTGSQSIRCVQFHFWAGQNDAGVGFFRCDREEGTSIAVCQCDGSVSGLGFRTVIGDNGLGGSFVKLSTMPALPMAAKIPPLTIALPS